MRRHRLQVTWAVLLVEEAGSTTPHQDSLMWCLLTAWTTLEGVGIGLLLTLGNHIILDKVREFAPVGIG